jgi:hypothetical protein
VSLLVITIILSNLALVMGLINRGSLIIKLRATISYAYIGGKISYNSLYSKC